MKPLRYANTKDKKGTEISALFQNSLLDFQLKYNDMTIHVIDNIKQVSNNRRSSLEFQKTPLQCFFQVCEIRTIKQSAEQIHVEAEYNTNTVSSEKVNTREPPREDIWKSSVCNMGGRNQGMWVVRFRSTPPPSTRKALESIAQRTWASRSRQLYVNIQHT